MRSWCELVTKLILIFFSYVPGNTQSSPNPKHSCCTLHSTRHQVKPHQQVCVVGPANENIYIANEILTTG